MQIEEELPFFNIIKDSKKFILNSSIHEYSVLLDKSGNLECIPRVNDYKMKQRFYSILGLLETTYSDYLIVVSKIKKVGNILDSPVYQVLEVIYLLI